MTEDGTFVGGCAGWTRSVGRGWVDVVDDDDGERLFFGDEFEAGVLRGEDEGVALIVGMAVCLAFRSAWLVWSSW